MIDISKDELRQMYKEKRMTVGNIAGKLGCTRSHILVKLKEYGIQPNLGKSWESANCIIPDVSPSSALSYILGTLKGDLSISNGCKLGMRSVDKRFVESVFESLRCIGLNPGMSKAEQETNKGYFKGWELWAGSKVFCDWYEFLKLEDIRQLINGYETDFIRGFYESEGTNTYTEYDSPDSPPDKVWRINQWQISMSNTNEETILFVKQLLENLGFNPYIVTGKVYYPNSEHLYALKIKREECEEFIQTISPCIKRDTY